MSIDLEQFHQIFFEESFEGLEIMESGLLNFDLGAADVEEINTIFRAAHSIKGGSGTFGFMDISNFTHIMETLLDEMRDGRREVTRECVDLLLESVDCLREMLSATKTEHPIDEQRVNEVHGRLEQKLSKHAADGGVQSQDSDGSSSSAAIKGWRIDFRPYAHLFQTGNDPYRLLRELQENVMRIRMLPIRFSFNRFPRLVHDLSGKLGKKVDLKLSGEQTVLDKTVLEKIADPLVHLVRNALDHGIESPEMRRGSGKPETGVVHLNAYHQGGNVVIEITDDGAGIDKQKLLDKSRQKGLIGPDEVMPEERIYDLLFAPGVSTAEKVSDVSGCGVGMDVVKRNIKDLGGNVEVKSTLCGGSTFTVRLPLTLAILDSQLVSVGQETYIIPLVSIIESLQIKSDKVSSISGRAQLYKLRDEYIPIIRLYDVFNVDAESENLDDGLLVVVDGDGQKAGLFVDDLLSQQPVVIKSLETNYRSVKGVSGATILGNGTVALILDISGVIECANSGSDACTAQDASVKVVA